MTMLKTLAATLCMTVAFAGFANAATVANATAGLDNPDAVVTFDEGLLADETPVTTQFAPHGLTFSSGLRVDTFPYPFANVSPRHIKNFSPIVSSFSMFFVSDVTDATFVFITNPGTSTFTALLEGVVVDSFSARTSVFRSSNFYGFTDILFDEIRFDPGGVNSAMLIDTVAYTLAVPAVPVPAGLPMLVGGLALFGVMRTRKSRA